MSIYAEIDSNNVVINTIIADLEFITTQTEKNYVLLTRGGIGWNFDGANFIAPQPFPSWSLDNNYDWQAPVPYPADVMRAQWDESLGAWVEQS
jgi:hypothetical protein